jgi:hypothetical protein
MSIAADALRSFFKLRRSGMFGGRFMETTGSNPGPVPLVSSFDLRARPAQIYVFS